MSGASVGCSSGWARTSPGSATGPAAIRADADRLAALKYRFVTAIEGCLNVAQHLCASEAWGPPATNAEALACSGATACSMLHSRIRSRAVGFRNVLVHGYVDVDEDRVVAQLDRVGDLDAFAAAVARWIG